MGWGYESGIRPSGLPGVPGISLAGYLAGMPAAVEVPGYRISRGPVSTYSPLGPQRHRPTK